MLPLLVVNLTVVLGPSIAAMYYAFTDWTGFGHANFVGLENLRALLHDADYLEALRHKLFWTAVSPTVAHRHNSAEGRLD